MAIFLGVVIFLQVERIMLLTCVFQKFTSRSDILLPAIVTLKTLSIFFFFFLLIPFSLEALTYTLKDQLTYSGRTHISSNFTQFVGCPTCTPDCNSHGLFPLDSFLGSDTSLCSSVALPALGKYGHVVFPDSIKFHVNSRGYAPFQLKFCCFSCADEDGFHDDIRYVSWEDILNLDATEFCEFVQARIDFRIPRNSPCMGTRDFNKFQQIQGSN